MNNKEYVRGAFDEIHAPDALFGKVMSMNKKETKTRNVLKYAVAAFAAFAVTFVASNGICYAATGETWVGKAIVYINGEKQERDITWTQDGDTLVGEIQVDAEEGVMYEVLEVANENGDLEVEDVQIELTDNFVDEEGDASYEGVYISEDNVPKLQEEDGRVYLVTGDEKVDITNDFADGEATGVIKYDGANVNYTVTGDILEHNIFLDEE